MEEFKSFLATIFFPPNRYRNFDNSLRTNIPLPGIFGVDPISGRPDLTPLVSGDARRGRDVFTIVCAACHREESGRGIGLDNEPVRRENGRIFKVAQLRNISDKLGMSTLTNSSRSGFGLRFDGRDDSFTRFLADVFGMKTRDEIADLNAFMLSFTGADILHNPTPGSFSRDTVAAVGRQVTVTNQADQAFLIKSMVALARSPTGRVDLVARGEKDGLSRGWAFDRTSGYFQSDRNNEDLSADNLMTLAGPTRELTLTMVPEGTGIRLGIDRDEDGYYDRTESDLGFNPIDSSSHGANHAPQIADLPTMTVHPGTPIAVTLQVTDADASQTVALSMDPGAPSGATFSPATGHFSWAVPTNSTVDSVEVVFRALDNGSPPLSDARALTIRVNRMRMTHRLSLGRLLLTWESIPGKTYRVQSTVMPGTTWEDLPAGPIVATAARTTLTIPAPITSGQRFYRVRWVQ
jgi:hypothetical protein